MIVRHRRTVCCSSAEARSGECCSALGLNAPAATLPDCRSFTIDEDKAYEIGGMSKLLLLDDITQALGSDSNDDG